mgnify:CR=1 FL=1
MNWLSRIVAIAVLGTAAPVQAQERGDSRAYFTGEQLWEFCGRSVSGLPPDVCTGYVVGVLDSASYVFSMLEFTGRLSCRPSGIPTSEVTDVVRLYLQQHPSSRSYSAASVIMRAMSASYPCPPPPSQRAAP